MENPDADYELADEVSIGHKDSRINLFVEEVIADDDNKLESRSAVVQYVLYKTMKGKGVSI
jgi:hypothetical protein